MEGHRHPDGIGCNVNVRDKGVVITVIIGLQPPEILHVLDGGITLGKFQGTEFPAGDECFRLFPAIYEGEWRHFVPGKVLVGPSDRPEPGLGVAGPGLAERLMICKHYSDLTVLIWIAILKVPKKGLLPVFGSSESRIIFYFRIFILSD